MLWHDIRAILNKSNKNQACHISQLNVNGKLISDPVKMTNISNKYFVDAGYNIDKSIPRTKKSAFDYLKNQNPNSLFLAPVTPQEIETVIQSLTKTNLSDHTVFQFFCLKLLVHIFQNLYPPSSSFETGIFPQKLKLKKVNSLHKKEAADLPSNFTPISILSCFSKIIGKLLFKNYWKKDSVSFWTHLRYFISCNLAFVNLILLLMLYYH